VLVKAVLETQTKGQPMTISRADLDAALDAAAAPWCARGLTEAQATRRVLDDNPAIFDLRKRLPAGDAAVAKRAPLTIGDLVRLAKEQTGGPATPSLRRVADVAHLEMTKERVAETGEPFGVASTAVLRTDAALAKLLDLARHAEAQLPYDIASAELAKWRPDAPTVVLDILNRPAVAIALAKAGSKGLK